MNPHEMKLLLYSYLTQTLSDASSNQRMASDPRCLDHIQSEISTDPFLLLTQYRRETSKSNLNTQI